MPRLISSVSRPSTGTTSTPIEDATDWITANWPMPEVVEGSRMTAACVVLGADCLISSSHFPLKLYSNCIKPVALPPGRERRWTKPAPTGSTIATNIFVTPDHIASLHLGH